MHLKNVFLATIAAAAVDDDDNDDCSGGGIGVTVSSRSVRSYFSRCDELNKIILKC